MWAATLLTALGVLVRAGHLLTPKMDSDQAVFGLQALHILRGEHRAFSWGYAYIGTLQSYLDAGFFLLFGPSRVVLNAVVLLFYIGYSFSLYYLAAALFRRVRERAIVTALGAVAPGYFVFHGVWARHGYPETFFFGTLILALVCNHLEREERARFYLALFFVAGLAWWSNFLIVSYFVPLGLYLAYQLLLGSSPKSRGRTLLASAAGFFAGSLPFWVFNLRNDFASLSMSRESPAFAPDFRKGFQLAWDSFPVLVGAREYREAWTVPHLGPALVALCAAALLFFVLRRSSLLPQALARGRPVPEDVLLVFFLALLLLFAGSRIPALAGTGGIRYLIPFYSFYPVLVGWFLFSLEKGLRRRGPALALTVFVFAMNAASVWIGSPVFHRERRERYRQEIAAERRLIDDLERAGRRRVLSYNYWDAYRITFDAGEKVVIDHLKSRHPAYLLDMFSGEGLSYLYQKEIGPFEQSARLLGFSFRKLPVESAVLCTDFRPDFDRDFSTITSRRYRLAGSDAGIPTGALGDRVLGSAYPATGREDGEGAFVEAAFAEPANLAGLSLFLEDPRFAPRHFRVTDPDSGRVLAEVAGVLHGFVAGGQPFLPFSPSFLEIYFPPRETRRVRIDFFDAARTPGPAVTELLFFEAAPPAEQSDELLFAQIGKMEGFDEVVSGMAAVRRLEQALGRKIAYSPERKVSLAKKHLFVFEKEYLRHNLDVLETLGIEREHGVGRTFAFIVARSVGEGEARWVEKALFRSPGREDPAGD